MIFRLLSHFHPSLEGSIQIFYLKFEFPAVMIIIANDNMISQFAKIGRTMQKYDTKFWPMFFLIWGQGRGAAFSKMVILVHQYVLLRHCIFSH